MLRSFRLGFATNSSSAHSIILHSDQKYLDMINGSSLQEAQYGRDDFSFTSRKEKLAYLIWAHERSGYGTGSAHDQIALLTALPKITQDLAQEDLDEIRDYVRDFDPESMAHQVLCPEGIDLDLWFSFLVDGPVAIHGWDDNAEASFEAETQKDLEHISLGYMTYRQDGDALIGYSSQTGLKFRWSRTSYDKSTIPELVDVKITDYCDYGCKFCYQGSTEEGKHAPFDRLTKIVDTLSRAGTFEIAVGGGEPVTHPNFAEMFELCKDRNITLNFTTYGVKWSEDEHHPVVQAMKDTHWTGGIGVSVHTQRDVEKAGQLEDNLRQAGIWWASVMAQTVVGVTPMKATRAILENCIEKGRPLLLLGYKTTGRGATYRQKQNREELREILVRAREAIIEEDKDGYGQPFTLSVDTAFLDLYGDLLTEIGVPKVLRTSPEGKFSMYIDAVANTAAASSYGGQESYVDWEPENLKSIFAQF